MEIDRNTANWSALTATKIRVKSTDISTIPHTTSININNSIIHLQLIPLFSVEERHHKAIQHKIQTENLLPPTQMEAPPSQPAIQRPLPGRTFHKHYIRLRKRVSWAPPQVLQRSYRPKEQQTHDTSSSPGRIFSGSRWTAFLTPLTSFLPIQIGLPTHL